MFSWGVNNSPPTSFYREFKKVNKPLGVKAYGHIPHLPGSRLGPGDHKIDPHCETIVYEKVRSKNEIVTVTEKIDGSCCAITYKNGFLNPLSRAGYLADTSPYLQHKLFSKWVHNNSDMFEFLKSENKRIVGEWCIQAHGTKYNFDSEPFFPFDIIDNDTNVRIPYENFINTIKKYTNLKSPHLIHTGPIKAMDALEKCGEFGNHGALDPIEGIVYRVETNGKFNFICKYVKNFKQDGKYLPEQNNNINEPVWNSFVSEKFVLERYLT